MWRRGPRGGSADPIAYIHVARPASSRRATRVSRRWAHQALIERAARLKRRKLTDFCMTALTDAARRTIAEHETLVLSDRDRAVFFDALVAARPGARPAQLHLPGGKPGSLSQDPGRPGCGKANAAFILSEIGEPPRILGYYTLCAKTIFQGDVPETARKQSLGYPLASPP